MIRLFSLAAGILAALLISRLLSRFLDHLDTQSVAMITAVIALVIAVIIMGLVDRWTINYSNRGSRIVRTRWDLKGLLQRVGIVVATIYAALVLFHFAGTGDTGASVRMATEDVKLAAKCPTQPGTIMRYVTSDGFDRAIHSRGEFWAGEDAYEYICREGRGNSSASPTATPTAAPESEPRPSPTPTPPPSRTPTPSPVPTRTPTPVPTPTPAPSVPGYVETVEVAPGDEELTVYWGKPATREGTSPTGYEITLSPGDHEIRTPPSPTHATVKGLENGRAYEVKVAAVNESGIGPANRATELAVPGPLERIEEIDRGFKLATNRGCKQQHSEAVDLEKWDKLTVDVKTHNSGRSVSLVVRSPEYEPLVNNGARAFHLEEVQAPASGRYIVEVFAEWPSNRLRSCIQLEGKVTMEITADRHVPPSEYDVGT